MIYVIFNKMDKELKKSIPLYEKIEFNKAVELSAELEQKYREEKKQLKANFSIIEITKNDQRIELYENGEFVFGSYFAPNLYIHIKKNLPKIRINKEKEKQKIIFMSKLEERLEEKYKEDEVIEDKELINLDKSRISYFKKWQRRTIYGIGLFFILLSIGLFAFFFIQIASINEDYQTLEKQKKELEKKTNVYATSLLGNDKKLGKYFESKEKLDSDEKKIYVNYLLDKGDMEKALKVYKDPSLLANFISKNKSIDVLKAFHEEHPTKEGKFDIAYENEDYETVLSIQDVENTVARSKKRTYAYLKTGEIEKAKEELENNNDDKLEKKINKYESIKMEINELNDKLESAKKKKSKKKIRKQIKSKKTELKKI